MTNIDKLLQLNLCDAFVVTSDVNRFYLTGFRSSFGFLAAVRGGVYYLTDFRYAEDAEAHFKDSGVTVLLGSGGETFESLKTLLAEAKPATLGVEENRITYGEYKRLRDMAGCETVDIGAAVEELRAVKTPEEIEKTAAAQGICDKVFSKVTALIKPGVSERDIAAEIDYRMMQLGAEGPSFETIVASGPNASRPHSRVSDRKLCARDFIVMDFGAKFKGYCSDMTRTVALGKPSPEMAATYALVLKAQKTALNALAGGGGANEAYLIVKEFFAANGVDKQFLHGLGHGVGLEIHEAPALNSADKRKLCEGMVLAVEPGLYLNGSYGVRIEDLVVITAGGIKNLTASNKELIVL